MDKWTLILLEVEGMWEANSYAAYLGHIGCNPQNIIGNETYLRLTASMHSMDMIIS